MTDKAETRATVAGNLEDGAARILETITDKRGMPKLAEESVAVAQVMATLAVSQRIADLTDRLEAAVADAFGDDSYLDRLQREVWDGLQGIRPGGSTW